VARNVQNRLTQLRSRRRGTDSFQRLALDEQVDLLAKSAGDERWEKRASAQPNTRYALGAMQEVGPDYTRISIDTAKRVATQLKTALTTLGNPIDFRLQGSVLLNVHIKGVSDVDLLVLDGTFFTYATAGLWSQQGRYTSPTSRTAYGVLSTLRGQVEGTLKTKYPAATVETSGGKAVKISGGSLARPVDVVPSHWFDTMEYQRTNDETNRAVQILDKKTSTVLANFPFLHAKRIRQQDVSTGGGLCKAIRLCKNVKSDAESEGTSVALPSFDIASVMYHANAAALQRGQINELAILTETQRHLDYLATNHEAAQKLLIPDGSRLIFDTQKKLRGLNALSVEMDDLLGEVAKEQIPLIGSSLSAPQSRAYLDGVTLAP